MSCMCPYLQFFSFPSRSNSPALPEPLALLAKSANATYLLHPLLDATPPPPHPGPPVDGLKLTKIGYCTLEAYINRLQLCLIILASHLTYFMQLVTFDVCGCICA